MGSVRVCTRVRGEIFGCCLLAVFSVVQHSINFGALLTKCSKLRSCKLCELSLAGRGPLCKGGKCLCIAASSTEIGQSITGTISVPSAGKFPSIKVAFLRDLVVLDKEPSLVSMHVSLLCGLPDAPYESGQVNRMDSHEMQVPGR